MFLQQCITRNYRNIQVRSLKTPPIFMANRKRITYRSFGKSHLWLLFRQTHVKELHIVHSAQVRNYFHLYRTQLFTSYDSHSQIVTGSCFFFLVSMCFFSPIAIGFSSTFKQFTSMGSMINQSDMLNSCSLSS